MSHRSVLAGDSHLIVSTAPTFTTAHPLPLSKLKQQLRIPDVSEYDSELMGMIESVTIETHDELGIQIPAATYNYYRNGFEDGMQLRRLPVTAVSSVNYLDADGTSTVLASTVYRTLQLNHRKSPAIVVLDYAQTFPVTRGIERDVWITFTCGYAAGSVPEDLQQLLILKVMQLYFGYDATRQMAIDRKLNHLRWQT